MSRIHTAVALGAAAALAAGVAAAPASAQVEADAMVFQACGEPQPSVADCVNWTFDTAQRTIDTAEATYDRTVGPYVCDVHWILTGTTCP